MSIFLSKTIISTYKAEVLNVEVPKFGYRWQGHVLVNIEKLGKVNLLMMGNVTQ